MRVVLGVAGGIAAYKAASLLRLFTEAGHEVTVVPTESALRFVGAPTWSALSGRPVATDVWDDVHQVRHVRLGQEADLVVVAPATADLLARAAHGLANDLLTNVLLTARGPVVLAPAMHTEMWQHAATRANVATLRERGVTVVEPASGRLTGADTGPGRLPDPETIYARCLEVAGSGAERGTDPVHTEPATGAVDPVRADIPGRGRLAGRRVVVSAGGTREPLDPVRFLGNRSSGKQGYALAAVAAERGADVVLVSANVSLPVPPGVRVVPVSSARELQTAMEAEYPRADVLVMAAAVADFRPADVAGTKIKKTHTPGEDPTSDDGDAPVIRLVRNPDILAGLVARRRSEAGDQGPGPNAGDTAAAGQDRVAEPARHPVIVGFAAETGDADGDVLFHARNKLVRKGVDLLVANEVGVDKTFGQDASTCHLLRPGTDEVSTVSGPKTAVAAACWDAVEALLPPS